MCAVVVVVESIGRPQRVAKVKDERFNKSKDNNNSRREASSMDALHRLSARGFVIFIIFYIYLSMLESIFNGMNKELVVDAYFHIISQEKQ